MGGVLGVEESREPRSKCVLTVEERERSAFRSIIDVLKDILRTTCILIIARLTLPEILKFYLFSL